MEVITAARTTLNPFRPGSGLFPPCLAGRLLDLELFSSKLYSTITGTPKNILVYGDAKMGKTSLLIRMERIAEEKKLLTVPVIGSPMDFREFAATLSVRLFMAMKNRGIPHDSFEASLQDFYKLPQRSLYEIEMAITELLLRAWEESKNYVPAIMFSVDDLDHLGDADQALQLLQNITKNLYRKDCPVIFVVSISAKDFERILKKQKDLTPYFESIRLNRLQMSSLINAIRVPLTNLDVAFDEAAVKEIARRSDGFPFYLQAIAHHVFEEMEGEFDTLALRRGYARAMQVLERDIFMPLYHGLTPTEVKIYVEVLSSPGGAFTQILGKLRIPKGSVASSLKRLKEKQMIDQDKKMYRVTDRLFGSYLERKIKKDMVATIDGVSGG